MSLTSSLGRRVPRDPTSAAELENLKRRAWQEQGAILIYPADITDEFARQAVINEAERLYGRRSKR